jgi:hypothetical protein
MQQSCSSNISQKVLVVNGRETFCTVKRAGEQAPKQLKSLRKILHDKGEGNMPWVTVTNNGHCFPLPLDSGCSCSFVRQDTFDRIR